MEKSKEKELLDQIEQYRALMHRTVDDRIDALIQRICDGGDIIWEAPEMPLSVSPAYFKGKKPTAVIFPDGHEVEVSTWRNAVLEIMKEYNTDPGTHERLMELRGNIAGRQRTILADSPEGMHRPLRIDQGLYMESYFDTESLLYVLTDRILDAACRDCGDIRIRYRPEQKRSLPMMPADGIAPAEPQEEPSAPEMKMKL